MSVTFSGLDSRRAHPRWPQAWAPVVLDGETDERPALNMTSANARAVLDVLGLHGDAGQDGPAELTGQVTLERARGACHVAAAVLRFGRPMTGALARWRPPGGPHPGAPWGDDTERRAYLLRRVEELAALVERYAAAGATHLSWG